MSDSNRTKVGWVKEVTYGTQPATPAYKNIRIKGSALSFSPKAVESKELRTDRSLQDVIRTANEAGGTLPLEVSYRSLDDLLEFLMQSSWVRVPVRDNNGTADTEISDVTAATGVYTIVTTGSGNTDYHYGAFAIGHLVRASGFTNAANNGLYRASAATATSVTLGNASTAETVPAAAARLKVVGFRGASADITATASGLGSTALNFTTLGLVPGMWIKIGGSAAGEQFATAVLNDWVRITVVAATALTCDNLPAGWTTDTGTGKTITVYVGDYIRNGATAASMTLEKQYTDLTTPEYDYLTGSMLDQLALALRSQAIIEATATFVSAGATNTTTRTASATDIAAATNDVLSSGANVAEVAENTVALTGDTAVTSLDLTITNSLRRRGALGSMGSVSLGSGTFRVKGKLSMYYASNTIRTKILAGTASSITIRTVDATAPNGSRAYVIDFPKVKYEEGNPSEPGIDTDRTMDPTFDALIGTVGTQTYMIQIQRLDEYAP